MSPILRVEGVTKVFLRYQRERHRILSWLGCRIPEPERHEVIHEMSFDLEPGEAVGLIGLNGAGKSTLLKLITGTLKPTRGQIQIHGQVSAILELGMGFNPELTGRQNVYLVAGLTGHERPAIDQVMEDIAAFSELEAYFDQPVRVYSSGMQMRLAFSIATAWRPDVLIVDEALSVGDAYFQHKSFERIRAFSRQGTTLLLVSHDKQAIQSICNRAILLDKGRIAMVGEPDAVMDFYNALLADHQQQQVIQQPTQSKALFSGTGEASFTEVRLTSVAGEPLEVVDVGQTLKLHIKARCHQPMANLVLGFLIKDRYGQDVFGTNTHQLNQVAHHLSQGAELSWSFVFSANIGPGSYSITLALHSEGGHIEHNYAWQERALLFEIVNRSHRAFSGVAWLGNQLECSWHHDP